MIGKLLINLGTWFNKHFPEKVSTDEVFGRFGAIELRLHDVTMIQSAVDKLAGDLQFAGERLGQLEKRMETLTSENTALKAQAALRVRVASSIPMPGR